VSFQGGYFEGDRHALYVGWVAMFAALNGLDVRVLTDDDGNYIDRLGIKLAAHGEHAEHELVVVVPPPPADWSVDQ
jgi:hypothetical protein